MKIRFPDKMRCDRNGGWDARTLGQAPHKPLMMLAVLDLIEAGQIRNNLIPYDDELLEAFDLYWSKLYGSAATNPLQPFWHMKGDGHWELVPEYGCAEILKHKDKVPALTSFRKLVKGAKLDDAHFANLLAPAARDELRSTILKTYFDAETAMLLAAGRQINLDAFQLRNELAARTRRDFQEIWNGPDGLDAKFTSESRQLAFRHVIVEAYAHTCAACGTHIRTPAGRSCLEAAHIIPFSVAKNDDPRNGLGLCPLHHWAFDQGMMAVGDDYSLIIHPYAKQLPASTSFTALQGQILRLPQDSTLHPAKKALKWHKNEFYYE